MAKEENTDVVQTEPDEKEFAPWEAEQATQEKLEKLEKSLSADAEAWMPVAGETLSGTIIGIDTRRSEFGEYPALTIQKLDGTELVFHAFRTVALNEVLRQRPKIGDLIAVLYIGISKDADYHGYRIRVGGLVERDYDWSKFSEKRK